MIRLHGKREGRGPAFNVEMFAVACRRDSTRPGWLTACRTPYAFLPAQESFEVASRGPEIDRRLGPPGQRRLPWMKLVRSIGIRKLYGCNAACPSRDPTVDPHLHTPVEEALGPHLNFTSSRLLRNFQGPR